MVVVNRYLIKFYCLISSGKYFVKCLRLLKEARHTDWNRCKKLLIIYIYIKYNYLIFQKISWMEKEKEKYPLTLKELLEKRKTMAKFRAQESYRHAKAHRQNKIKSKKYHRLLRKEKTKEQIKEFEKLQDTDPIAALDKLNVIEKTRAEERASLRHKSTGQWARNHVVRAKYDKEVSII